MYGKWPKKSEVKRLRGIKDLSIQFVIYDPIGEQWTQQFLQRYPHCSDSDATLY